MWLLVFHFAAKNATTTRAFERATRLSKDNVVWTACVYLVCDVGICSNAQFVVYKRGGIV